jgi:hypothetical protein
LENFQITDHCHGQHSHHHVNHIIMLSTKNAQAVRARVAVENVKNIGVGALLEDEVGKMRTRL